MRAEKWPTPVWSGGDAPEVVAIPLQVRDWPRQRAKQSLLTEHGGSESPQICVELPEAAEAGSVEI